MIDTILNKKGERCGHWNDEVFFVTPEGAVITFTNIYEFVKDIRIKNDIVKYNL